MKKLRTVLLSVGAFMAALPLMGAPRTVARMKAVAAEAINAHMTTQKRAPRTGEVKTFVQAGPLHIMGYDEGGFAVVTDDDLLPELLGYGDGRFDGDQHNCAFQWWLSAATEAGEYFVSNGISRQQAAPGPQTRGKCAPLLKTKWGQMEPYNNMCPTGTYAGDDWQEFEDDTICVVGCVATAFAQCMKYCRYPLQGQGTHSVRVKQKSGQWKTYTVDFSEAFYDWDNMLDDYTDGYTDEQAAAVALLSYHVGVASDMQYAIDGSGTSMQSAYEGMLRNFGYPDEFGTQMSWFGSTREMANAVYADLDRGNPVIASGSDMNIMAGHAWVLDGYDERGFVHCNWGWYGRDDGYFDLSLLDPEGYSFNFLVTLLTNFVNPETEFGSDSLTVTLPEPGTLKELIAEDSLYRYAYLKVCGDVNSNDLAVIRHMAGRNSVGGATQGRLSELDLSEARIIAGGAPFLADGSVELTTEDDALPERAFFSCTHLHKLTLPASLERIGEAAFALSGLSELNLGRVQTDYFSYADGLLLSADGTQLLGALPAIGDTVAVPSTVKHIAPFALAGCHELVSLELPEGVDSIAPYAIYDCGHLKQLIVHNQQPPGVGKRNFVSLGKNCLLVVPDSCGKHYKEADVWSIFFTSKNYRWKEENGPVINSIRPTLLTDDGRPETFDVYNVSGVLLRRQATTTSGLPCGLYLLRRQDGQTTKVTIR